MKLSTGTKVAILVALGACSSAVTRAILAQSGKREVGAQNPTGQNVAHRLTRVQVPRAAAAANNGPAPEHQFVTSSGTFDGMSVVPTRDGIAVSAAVTLFDRASKNSYAWTISIRDANGKEVRGLNYDRQVFRLASPEPKTFTFNDSFQVAPGSYTVQLKLWTPRAGLNIAALRAEGTRHPDNILGGSQKVIVGQ